MFSAGRDRPHLAATPRSTEQSVHDPVHLNRGSMDATTDCNILIDVFGQHFNNNFRLRHVFLQEITRKACFTLLKYQNG